MFSVETQVSIEIANSHTLVNIQFWQKEGRGKLYLYVFCQDQYFILATSHYTRALGKRGY